MVELNDKHSPSKSSSFHVATILSGMKEISEISLSASDKDTGPSPGKIKVSTLTTLLVLPPIKYYNLESPS